MALTIGRRELIAALGGITAWPLAARAQQPALPVIGFLNAGFAPQWAHLVGACRSGLGPDPKSAQAEIATLSLAIDLLVVWSTVGGVAAKRLALPIPVVFLSVSAPVDIGLVSSLRIPAAR